MVFTLTIICLTILSLILIGIILYLLISKSYRIKLEKVRKEIKLIRKELLNKTYNEINEKKHHFKQQNSQEIHQLQLERKQLELEKNLLRKNEIIFLDRQKKLDIYEDTLLKRSENYDKKLQILMDSLSNLSGLNQSEAKKILMDQVKKQLYKEMSSYVKNVELETAIRAQNIANSIIIEAMERYGTEIVIRKTSNIIKLPNDEIKGRIIGKEGRNLKAFEQFSGVDIIIDETPKIITLSCFNPLRREVATRTLQKLIYDGRIQPARIETELKNQEKALSAMILEHGHNALQELGITDMEIPLVRLLGKLNYRTSYGQNVLQHSLEVAKIAGTLAGELGLNAVQATRAGLLHDIGKAVDFEEEGSHVTLGVNVARKYNEDDVIINAIEAHHEDVPKESFIASLVAIA